MERHPIWYKVQSIRTFGFFLCFITEYLYTEYSVLRTIGTSCVFAPRKPSVLALNNIVPTGSKCLIPDQWDTSHSLALYFFVVTRHPIGMQDPVPRWWVDKLLAPNGYM